MKIKLYTSKSCFHCTDVKRRLNELNIEYEELDAFTHKEELDSLELPVIKLGDKEVSLEKLIKTI